MKRLSRSIAALSLLVALAGPAAAQELHLELTAPGVPGVYGFAAAGENFGYQVTGRVDLGASIVLGASLPGPGGLGDFDPETAWVMDLDRVSDRGSHVGRAHLPLALAGSVIQLRAAAFDGRATRVSQTFTLVVEPVDRGADSRPRTGRP
ncbi:MAG: hypothetical protein R3F20_11765 [Planctomycetota bacterium]